MTSAMTKVVATREAVRTWHHAYMHEHHPTFPYNNAHDVSMILAALSHFALPASNAPILRMDQRAIELEIRQAYHQRKPGLDWPMVAAEVVHRLAQPMPEVDRDAGARAVHAILFKHAPGMTPLNFDKALPAWREACRAVAAAVEKGNG